MAVQALNHINIVAEEKLLKRVRDFYVAVIGLTEGSRPGFSFKGYWLFAGDSALIHLMEPRPGIEASHQNTGAIDHFAFTCSNLEEMEQRIERSGVEYQISHYPARNLSQIFLRDPSGVRIELNFSG